VREQGGAGDQRSDDSDKHHKLRHRTSSLENLLPFDIGPDVTWLAIGTFVSEKIGVQTPLFFNYFRLRAHRAASAPEVRAAPGALGATLAL
jgi:hypothetical protein